MYYKSGQYLKAIECFDKAENLESNQNNLIDFYLEKGNFN